jgi:hypothetical protein
MVEADVGPPFKPKKWGVIPPKRKLVKRMMFDSILKSIATLLCCPHRHPSGPSPSDIGLIISPPNKSTENVKNMKIFPHGGHQVYLLQFLNDHQQKLSPY